MSSCSSKIQPVKKIKVNDEDDEPAVQCHQFWNEAPEDLLMEIFIRHPDCRSAARTSTVCRQWHSLIFRNPQFIQRFKLHHKHPVIPWTIMIRDTNFHSLLIPKPQHFRNICQLYSEEWIFLYGKFPVNFLDFLPLPMLIKASCSCNDLLLVSPSFSYTDDIYICNPITKQFVQIPAIPRLEDRSIYKGESVGYALVPIPPTAATTNSHFKVVVVLPPAVIQNLHSLQVQILSSESRKWEIRDFPAPHLPDTWWSDTFYSYIIRCNEVLFWVGCSSKSETIVYLDLSKEKCGAIDIPYGAKNIPSDNKLLSYEIGILHVSGGLHELRLIQLLSMDATEDVHLKVWRLNNNYNNNNHENDSNWFLVHNKKLKRPNNVRKELPRPNNVRKELPGTFVHPTNGDLVFLVWDKTVLEYNLINETYKKIYEHLEIAYCCLNLAPFLIDLPSGSSNLSNIYF